LGEACLTVLQLFDLSFDKAPSSPRLVQFCAITKGLKFVCKTLRVIPEPYSVLLIQACILSWNEITKNVLPMHEEALQKQFSKDLCFAVSQLNLKSLCSVLNCLAVNNTDASNERIWDSVEGRKVVSIILNRGYELSKKDKTVPEWKVLFGKIFDALRPSFRQFASTNKWEFLIDISQNADRAQRKNLLDDVRPVVNQTNTPQVKQFMQVAQFI
jgi:hypothetical protein